MNKALTSERVAALEPFMVRRANELIDQFSGDDGFELMAQYGFPFPIDTSLELYGLYGEDIETLREGSYALMELLGATQLTEDEQVSVARKVVAFRKTMVGYVRQRRHSPRNDLLSEVIEDHAPHDKPLPDERWAEQLQENLVGVFLASNIPISNALSTGLGLLLRNRDQWELLCEQPELIPAAVEEMLRFESPAPGIFRTATRPVVVADEEYPAGTRFFILFGSANRDPGKFDNAGKFDIRRAASRHLTFGSGRHVCVGAPLARKELAVTLELFTRRLPNLTIDPNETIEIRPSLFERGAGRVQLILNR